MSIECADDLNLRSDPSKRKRLGQYFTGPRLAKLLASLALPKKAVSIIDPMNGSGDMIGACLSLGVKAKHIVGVEIDLDAHLEATRRFGERHPDPVELVHGDAFSLETIKRFPVIAYDLVITNPPYVRYQRQNKIDAEGLVLEDAKTIRQRLLTIAEFLPSLAPNDRQLFRDLITRYSGLSDLAVPAWLLCAMLTEIGGTLAMVVPATWLSRNYASIVQYLLLRCFEIRYVVEDESAAWFKDALVKTTLLVAKRVKQRPSAFQWADEGYVQTYIPSNLATERSVVGELFPATATPDREFARILLNQFEKRENLSVSPISITWVPMSRKAENLRRTGGINKWLIGLELPSPVDCQPSEMDSDENVFLHPVLSSWLGGNAPRFASLASFGVKIGQGLRTGANQFFYTDVVKLGPDFSVTSPNPIFGFEPLTVPNECLLPVLRRQSELPETFQINSQDLKGRVFALQKYVLPEDSNPSRAFGEFNFSFTTMPDGLASFVREVAKKNLGTEADPRYVPEFSAVRTNVRPFDSAKPSHSERYWYMLPDFAPRHRPDLFVARVNYIRPKTYLNALVPVLIDANFSTLWLTNDAQIGPHALLALLNSIWCVTAMELTGTVMGGGALKLEAAHLRRLPIPPFSSEHLAELEKLGQGLSESCNALSVLSKIDEFVISVVQSQATHTLSLHELMRIRDEQLARRFQKR